MIDEKLIQEYNESLGDKAPKNPGCVQCLHLEKEEIRNVYGLLIETRWYCKKKPVITYDSLEGYHLHYAKCSDQNKEGRCQLFEQKPK